MRGNSAALAKASGGRVALLLALAALTIPAAFLINRAVPSAYMDEEFHVRQVQHYCRGDFEFWDPMITTFPGLYIVSLAYLRSLLPLGLILGFKISVNDFCQPAVLRSVNIAFSFICALLFREIFLHLDPEKSTIRASLRALVLSLYPLHWFFSFLYYTESGSATAVMAMYLASLKHAYWSSALFGAISVLLRQTNAVWIIFVLCVGLLDFLQDDLGSENKAQLHDDRLSPGAGKDNAPIFQSGNISVKGDVSAITSITDEEMRKGGTRKRKSARVALSSKHAQDSNLMVSKTPVQGFGNEGTFSEIWALMERAWFRRDEVLWNFGPLLLVVVTFIGFVLHNGSIVVGDKGSHKVSLHFAQLLYCGFVSTGFLASLHFSPENLSYLSGVLKTSSIKKSVAYFIIMAAAAFIAVHYFSSAHPYLLADNRHYVFYFWKDVLQRHWTTKYAFIPLYVFSWWSIFLVLGQRQKVLWVVGYGLATAGVLVPTPLLEFRYYNVPFYFMFLHSTQKISDEKYILVLTALQYMAVNIITVYIFLAWPFRWPSEPGNLQRFIW